LELWSDRQSPVTLLPLDELPGRYYMRFEVLDQPGVMAQIATILGEEKLSIASIIQHESDPDSVAVGVSQPINVVIMTHDAPEGAAKRAEQRIMKLPVVQGKSVRLRVLEARRKN
jgi:homoserine dehydrogenase